MRCRRNVPHRSRMKVCHEAPLYPHVSITSPLAARARKDPKTYPITNKPGYRINIRPQPRSLSSAKRQAPSKEPGSKCGDKPQSELPLKGLTRTLIQRTRCVTSRGGDILTFCLTCRLLKFQLKFPFISCNMPRPLVSHFDQ
jgi:hypothetical protein